MLCERSVVLLVTRAYKPISRYSVSNFSFANIVISVDHIIMLSRKKIQIFSDKDWVIFLGV